MRLIRGGNSFQMEFTPMEKGYKGGGGGGGGGSKIAPGRRGSQICTLLMKALVIL